MRCNHCVSEINRSIKMERTLLTNSTYQRGKLLNKHIGKKIQKARKAAGFSIDQLAAELTIGNDVLADYESGQLQISPIELLILAEKLGVEFGYFFDGFSG